MKNILKDSHFQFEISYYIFKPMVHFSPTFVVSIEFLPNYLNKTLNIVDMEEFGNFNVLSVHFMYEKLNSQSIIPL